MSGLGRRAPVALLVVVLAGAAVWWVWLRPGDSRQAPDPGAQAAGTSGDPSETGRAKRLDPPDRPHLGDSAVELPALLARLRGAAKKAPPDGGPAASYRLAKLFRGDCQFGVEAHCSEWAERATRCDEGDSQECIELGELLIGESPMQPLWGSLLLQRACAQGRGDVCERAGRWSEWSRYGYSPTGDPEPPEDLAEACRAGNRVACGLIEMRRARGGGAGFDRDAALAACRAGFRDVCAALIEAAEGPDDVVEAFTAGCELPDAWMCMHLAGYLSTYCADADPPPHCSPPDPERAARLRQLACELDPEMQPCSYP